MKISLEQRVTALVDVEVEYEVDASEFQALKDEGYTDLEALEELRSDGKAVSTSYDSEVVDVVMIHDETAYV